MKEAGYKKLIAYQKADELVYRVYRATKDFQKHEMYGITSQLRRVAASVPTNIVEGYTRFSKGELKQFVNIALGSLAETEYLLDLSLRLGYLTKDNHGSLQRLRQETGNLLWKFYKSI